MEPMVAVVAGADPVRQAKNMEDSTDTIPHATCYMPDQAAGHFHQMRRQAACGHEVPCQYEPRYSQQWKFLGAGNEILSENEDVDIKYPKGQNCRDADSEHYGKA